MSTPNADSVRVRCEGGYRSMDNPLLGQKPPRAACPSCGKVTAFHWSTGKFRAHNKPQIDGSADGSGAES